MRVIGRRLIFKAAVFAAALIALLATAQLSERKAVTTWAPNAKLDVGGAPVQVRSERVARHIPAEHSEAQLASPPTPRPQFAAATAAPVELLPTPSSVLDVGTTGNVTSAATPPPEPHLRAVPARGGEEIEALKKQPRALHRPAAQNPARVRADQPLKTEREPVQFRLAEGHN